MQQDGAWPDCTSHALSFQGSYHFSSSFRISKDRRWQQALTGPTVSSWNYEAIRSLPATLETFFSPQLSLASPLLSMLQSVCVALFSWFWCKYAFVMTRFGSLPAWFCLHPYVKLCWTLHAGTVPLACISVSEHSWYKKLLYNVDTQHNAPHSIKDVKKINQMSFSSSNEEILSIIWRKVTTTDI